LDRPMIKINKYVTWTKTKLHRIKSAGYNGKNVECLVAQR